MWMKKKCFPSVIFALISFLLLLLFVREPKNIFNFFSCKLKLNSITRKSCSYSVVSRSVCNSPHPKCTCLTHWFIAKIFTFGSVIVHGRDCPIWWQCVINYYDDALVAGFSHVSTFQRDSKLMFPMLSAFVRIIAHSFALSFDLLFFLLSLSLLKFYK